MYRSLVRRFVHGMLSLLDEGRDLSFDDVTRLGRHHVVESVLSIHWGNKGAAASAP